jgi:hypothetical protein
MISDEEKWKLTVENHQKQGRGISTDTRRKKSRKDSQKTRESTKFEYYFRNRVLRALRSTACSHARKDPRMEKPIINFLDGERDRRWSLLRASP